MLMVRGGNEGEGVGVDWLLGRLEGEAAGGGEVALEVDSEVEIEVE